MQKEMSQGKKLLLHICCAPDATVVLNDLSAAFDITAYFYNPNIHPLEEYTKRLGEMQKLAARTAVPLAPGGYDIDDWRSAVAGLEHEPEGGKRCAICFRVRLERAARYAAMNGFDCFTTVLTVSPHKDARLINEIGAEIGAHCGIEFIKADFKKKDGFKRSIALSRQYGLYRQSYCGCVYSIRASYTAVDREGLIANKRRPDAAANIS
jgi:hypothetical protein